MPTTTVHQRSDLTFKHNRQLWRHGWLRLTPAYSVKVVEELLDQLDVGGTVFDPFCGTGTTALSATDRGDRAVSVDINPFLTWLSNAKLRHYSADDIARTESFFADAMVAVNDGMAPEVAAPQIHKVDRWWDFEALTFLKRLKYQIEKDLQGSTNPYDLALVIFCRILIETSNAAFNHQSVSFKTEKDRGLSLFSATRLSDITHNATYEILESASKNPCGTGCVYTADARTFSDLSESKFDVLVTSPPYPNRMSYIRELRPYMYWLGYLSDARAAGELDWQAVGGTWGVATSRVGEWTLPSSNGLPSYLIRVAEAITSAHPKNGRTLARYVLKYFHDMNEHFGAVRGLMRPGSRVHYVIGNSLFYGIHVESARIYEDLMLQNGFTQTSTRVLRKRNSKKELFEYLVSATA